MSTLRTMKDSWLKKKQKSEGVVLNMVLLLCRSRAQ